MQDDLSSAQISINSPEKQKTIPVDGNFPIILIYLLHLKKIYKFSEAASQSSTKTVSFFSIEYYQQFFNIDTSDVIERILFSLIPKKAPSNYLKTNLSVNPDLYGPIWVGLYLKYFYLNSYIVTRIYLFTDFIDSRLYDCCIRKFV